MTTAYPAALDSFSNPVGTDTLNTVDHAAQHDNANDAIGAIETALGVKHGARCRATRASVQGAANSTWTALFFDAEDFDTDAFHSTSTNTDRVTIPASMGGIYLIVANDGAWAPSATGQRAFAISKNGVPGVGTILATQVDAGSAAAGLAGNNVSAIASLSAGDYVQAAIYQNSGGALNGNANGSASLTVIKLA